ncbi:MAG: hypothetical protein E6Q77_01785 [Rhizobium sp.]|nr:MAG: hypothetical protein E6Q77_01785 [Rhizobium sp.]
MRHSPIGNRNFLRPWLPPTPHENREIISTVIALAQFAGGFGGLSIGGIGLGTIGLGVAVGASFAIQALNAPKAGSGIGAATAINAPEARGNVQQSAPIKKWIYGRVRTGGAVFFLDDSKPPYLYLGLLLSARRISGIRGVHISTNDIALSSFAFDTEVLPLPVEGQIYQKAGVNRLSMAFGAGTPGQLIDPILDTDFPNLDSSFRQRGIARAVFKFKFGDDAADFEKMWGQGVSVPNPLIDIDGAPIYDPRDPTQFYPSDWRDKDEVAAAMATWKYRVNGKEVGRTSSLVQADWLGHPSGVNYPPGRIRWDEIAKSADFDEEPVANKDGTSRPRGTIDGVVTLDQSPRTVIEAMLTTNQGFVVQDRGHGWVQPSMPRAPVLTIDDDMMQGGFDFQCNRAKTDLVNEVTAKFPAADREYQDTDGPTLTRDDLIESDGETLSRNIRLPYTSDHRAVQQIEKQYVETSRLPRSWSGPVKVRAIVDDLKAGACVRIWSKLYPDMNGLYDVVQTGFLDDFSGLPLSLKECDPNIPIAWDPATDEQDFTLPPLNVS